MGLAGPRISDKYDILLFPYEVTGGAVIDYLFVYGGLEGKVNILQRLVRRQFCLCVSLLIAVIYTVIGFILKEQF